MKKYLSIICLAVISIIGLGVYYIGNANAYQQNLTFEFETLEGDEKQLDNLLLETTYYEDNFSENYFIKNKEATLVDNKEFYYEHNYDFLKLFKEQKNFFRAKQFTGRHYFNDKQSLVYVYIEDQYNYENPNKVLYKVDRLNKKTDEREKVEFIVEIDDHYSWQTVEWVNNKDNKLQVLSVRTKNHGADSVILTTFNFEDGTAMEKVIVEPIKNYSVVFQHSTDSYNSLSETVFTHYNASERHPSFTLYHYEAEGGLHTLNNPKNDDYYLYSYSLNERFLTATKYVDNQLLVKLYNLTSKKWEKELTIETTLHWDMGTPRVQQLNDKLYVLYEVEKGFVIEVVNSKNGEKLYAGLMTVKDVESEHFIRVNQVYDNK